MLRFSHKALFISFILLSFFLIIGVLIIIVGYDTLQFNKYLEITRSISLHNQRFKVQIDALLHYFTQRNNDTRSIIQHVSHALDTIKNNIQYYLEISDSVKKQSNTSLHEKLSIHIFMMQRISDEMSQSVARSIKVMQLPQRSVASNEALIIDIQLHDMTKQLSSFNQMIFLNLNNDIFMVSERNVQARFVIGALFIGFVLIYLLCILYFIIPGIEHFKGWLSKTTDAIMKGDTFELAESRHNMQELLHITTGINDLIVYKGAREKDKKIIISALQDVYEICQEQMQEYSAVLQNMYRVSSFVHERYQSSRENVISIGRISQEYSGVIAKTYTAIHNLDKDIKHCLDQSSILHQETSQIYAFIHNPNNIKNAIQTFVHETQEYIQLVDAKSDSIAGHCFSIEQSNKNIKHLSERIMILAVNKTIEYSTENNIKKDEQAIQETTMKEGLQNISQMLSKYVGEIEKNNQMIQQSSSNIMRVSQERGEINSGIHTQLWALDKQYKMQQEHKTQILQYLEKCKTTFAEMSEQLVFFKESTAAIAVDADTIKGMINTLLEYLRNVSEVGTILNQESSNTIYASRDVKRRLVSIIHKAINQSE